MTAEQIRLNDHYSGKANWLTWGPYVSERQWGTVREDYSANGDAWNYTTHDMARSKAYRWGEEGISGFCDSRQNLCLGLSLWNGKDPILKERLFGLTNAQGNHGEDVKELYYYLDGTPTHSYMKMLYKYTIDAYPYQWLIDENGRRGKTDPEFELIDTGMFDDNRYFDVFIEFAKQADNDILIRYTVYNRSAEQATLHFLPQLWFRNTWDWGTNTVKPQMRCNGNNAIIVGSESLGNYTCYTEGAAEFLFTENETNNERLYGSANISPFVKDGINERVVNNNTTTVNPANKGTKAAIWYNLNIPAQAKQEIRLRLVGGETNNPFQDFDQIFASRIAEADEFYAEKQNNTANADERMVQRQAWAGMLWNKQFYLYDVNRWLNGDPGQIPPPVNRQQGRNHAWQHLMADDIISMPDKWEYPWFAAWDLAFHCLAYAPIDPDFAKQQLALLVDERYIDPDGQLPAYEWNFGDVNPPVHALAALQVYQIDKQNKGKGDFNFLETVYQKLLLNFTWWVNQKDSEGNNIFEGGFLGLDNIGVFNRSAPVPGGGLLEQADGTSWMAMYAINMLQISVELAMESSVYEEMAVKFAEHFLFIAGAMANMGNSTTSLWDDEDGFFYDVLRKPDGSADRLPIRTIVGLIPLFAVIVFTNDKWDKLPLLKTKLEEFITERPDLVQLISYWKQTNGDEQHLFSLLRGHRMKMLLRRMLDPNEFLSDNGIRSVSKIYGEQPFNYQLNGTDFTVRYTPAESDTGMFGGNSNWRGPVWMPLNYLVIKALYNFYDYYGDDFKVEFPTGSGQYATLAAIADNLKQRLKNIFLFNEKGERPVFGGYDKFNHDPDFQNYILFHEYFNGNNGKGLGASHQTGWTGLIALL